MDVIIQDPPDENPFQRFLNFIYIYVLTSIWSIAGRIPSLQSHTQTHESFEWPPMGYDALWLNP